MEQMQAIISDVLANVDVTEDEFFGREKSASIVSAREKVICLALANGHNPTDIGRAINMNHTAIGTAYDRAKAKDPSVIVPAFEERRAKRVKALKEAADRKARRAKSQQPMSFEKLLHGEIDPSACAALFQSVLLTQVRDMLSNSRSLRAAAESWIGAFPSKDFREIVNLSGLDADAVHGRLVKLMSAPEFEKRAALGRMSDNYFPELEAAQ